MPDHSDKKRKFVRHPSDIPIIITETELSYEGEKTNLRNISFAGLSFLYQHSLKEDTIIHFKIPFVEPVFEADGRVAWCLLENEKHRVGIEFLGKVDAYRGRMVEQVCYIEHYRRERSRACGIELSSEEVAQDWIDKYAEEFPQM